MPDADTDSQRPNALLLTAHDMGRYLGCYGRQAHTPNFDEFAEEGALFEQFFCTTPHCAPSRASVQTGLLPHNHGQMGHPDGPPGASWSKGPKMTGWHIDEDIRTLPMYLDDIGYETHLAEYQHTSRPVGRAGHAQIHEHPDPDGQANGARNVADTVERVLEGAAEADAPFYLQTATGNTHSDYSRREGGFKDDPTPGYEGPAPDELDLPAGIPDTEGNRRDLADLLEDAYELDYAFGRILDALDERGLAEDTLVALVTDHGIDIHPKGKGTCYDPGIESALLMRLPGRIEAGGRHDDPVSNVDVLPTVLDLLGVDVPYGLDGRSLRPLLEGSAEYESRDAVFAETTWFRSYVPVRVVRTDRYKLVRNFWPRRIEAAEGHDYYTEFELYDLERDPEETENLAGNPEYADVRAALHARLARKLVGDDDPIVDGPIPPGMFDVTLREPATVDGDVIGDDD